MRKRIVALIIAGQLVAAIPLFAQGRRHALRVNGWGGFGFGYTKAQSGNGVLVDSSFRDVSSEFGVDAEGFLYDPRLLNYTFSTVWDGNNTSIDQGSARSRGLNLNGSLGLLSERAFPITFYFSRGRSDNSGSMLPAYLTTNSLWGVRGELKKPGLGFISYNLGQGNTENSLFTRESFRTKQRFANLTATRKLLGWDLRFAEDYLRSSSTFSNFLQRNNTLSFSASRAYGERVHVDLGASHSGFLFQDTRTRNSTESAVTLVSGAVAWKHTEKLDSSYSFGFSRNAVNAVRILGGGGTDYDIPLPFNAPAADTMTESFGANANYRATPRLTLTTNLSFSHNAVPEGALAALPPSARNAFTTSVLNTGTAYSYRRKLWKLEYRNGGSVSWQHFNLATGASDSGLGFSIDNGVGGGSIHKARFDGSYHYSRRSNPIFFNVVTSTDHRVNLKVETDRLRFFTIQAIAEVGKSRLDLAGSDLSIDVRNYMISVGRGRLSVYGSHSTSNSNELFFGPGSVLFQPGGSTGGVVIQRSLLVPRILSDVSSDRIGVTWYPRQNLQMEGRYSRNRFTFASSTADENRFWQLDFTIQYKIGRFTILGGYGRASAEASRFHQNINRFLFRVRFPFHLL